jgi:hypothetical protein
VVVACIVAAASAPVPIAASRSGAEIVQNWRSSTRYACTTSPPMPSKPISAATPMRLIASTPIVMAECSTVSIG